MFFLTCHFSFAHSPNFKQSSLDFTCKETLKSEEKIVAINMKLLNFVIKAVVICTYEAWETVQEMCICQWDWMIPLTKT